jgi:hypothetical protein
MLRMSLCTAMALAFTVSAAADDKIGKETAPNILKKVKPEMEKKQGFHVSHLLQFPSSANNKDMKSEGVSKKDFAAFSGDQDIYCKQGKTLVKDANGKFVDPSKMSGAEQVQPFCMRNPSMLLAEIYGLGVASKWTGEESVGDVECKIAETKADANMCENQLKTYFKVIPPPPGLGNWDATSVNNKNKSTSTYKVWIGKEDLLVYKIEWALVMAVDQAKAGGPQYKMPDTIGARWTLELSQYDESLEVEVPKEIAAAFGIKK